MPPPGVRKEGGVLQILVPLFIVFALVASTELARTVVAAQRIDTTVSDITGSVKGANTNLNTGCSAGQSCSGALPVLTQTEGIVAQIDEAAKPLAGETKEIVASVNNIDATASQILTMAGSINSTVHSINNLAGSINGSVKSIGTTISGINTTVVAIRGGPVPGSPFQSGVIGINNRADAVIGLVNAIKADTGTINADAGGILTQAHGISCDKIVGLVGPLSGTC